MVSIVSILAFSCLEGELDSLPQVGKRQVMFFSHLLCILIKMGLLILPNVSVYVSLMIGFSR